jgi:hypothetical protein
MIRALRATELSSISPFSQALCRRSGKTAREFADPGLPMMWPHSDRLQKTDWMGEFGA